MGVCSDGAGGGVGTRAGAGRYGLYLGGFLSLDGAVAA